MGKKDQKLRRPLIYLLVVLETGLLLLLLTDKAAGSGVAVDVVFMLWDSSRECFA